MVTPFDFASLHQAWLDCRRGKGNALARWAFESALERNLLELSTALQDQSYQPAPSVCFVSNQPKRREIFAAAFRDRVVHHLLIRQIAPYWERRFIHDSYACRVGKGTLAAVERTQQFIREVSSNGSRPAFYLHLDIRSFFVSIDKRILLDMVLTALRKQGLPWAAELAWLAECIVMRDPSVDAMQRGRGLQAVPAHKSLFYTGNRTGLPIGNYTSQFFANIYLDQLDQWVKHTLKIPRYLRYVDDLLLLDHDPARLLEAEQQIAEFLRRRLQLELNHRSRSLGRVASGIDAFGYIVHCHHRYLRRRTVRRFRAVLAVNAKQVVPQAHAGRVLHLRPGQAERLAAVCASYAGLMGHANCQRLQTAIKSRHPWLGLLMQRSRRGHLIRRFSAPGPHASLAAQWWGLRRLWPRARLLLQVGTHYEAYGLDALWLQHRFGLAKGPDRAGFRHVAGFACAFRALLRRIVAAADRPVLVFREVNGQQGAVRARELSLMFNPTSGVMGPAGAETR